MIPNLAKVVAIKTTKATIKIDREDTIHTRNLGFKSRKAVMVEASAKVWVQKWANTEMKIGAIRIATTMNAKVIPPGGRQKTKWCLS